MRIGIDVGGTNTDAVLMDGTTVIGHVKHSTSKDITGGIGGALAALQQQYSFSPSAVQAVMIGTTHFLNALIEQRGLAPTAALRLGLPATAALPPMVGGGRETWSPLCKEGTTSLTVGTSSTVVVSRRWTPTRFAAMPPIWLAAVLVRSQYLRCSLRSISNAKRPPRRSCVRNSARTSQFRSRTRSVEWVYSSGRTRPSSMLRCASSPITSSTVLPDLWSSTALSRRCT